MRKLIPWIWIVAIAYGAIQTVAQESPAESADSEAIEEVRVVGSRAALHSAMLKQRDADKLISVVDSDALGNFSDINVAESLRRVAGVMVENDQGEGRYVTVRGMNADLNAMTINGVSSTSPEDRRGIMLDGVPTDMLESMTVYKTLTPDLDADTIGGSIDLETLSAFKYDDRYFRVKGESSWNELSEDTRNPKLSATYTDRMPFVGGELGVAIVLSDQSRHIVAHNNENGGWSDSAPNDDYELRFYDLERERSGIVANLDFESANGIHAYVRSFHNSYQDTEYRGKWETRDGLEDNEPIVNGSVFSYADSKIDTEARWRPEQRKISAFQIGMNWPLSNGNDLTIELFSSDSEQDDTDKYATIYRSGKVKEPILYDNSNPKVPMLTYSDEFTDPSNFPLKVFEHEPSLTTDSDVGAKIDMTLGLNSSTKLQYGLKLRQRKKQHDANYCGYEPLDDILLTETGLRDISPYLNTVHGPAPSSANVRSYLSQIGSGLTYLSDGTSCRSAGPKFEFSGDEEEESVPADWTTDENIRSGYLMATTQLENAHWVYGLRYENTNATYRGKNFDGDEFTGFTSISRDHGFLAPSVNLKYQLSERRIARVGIFRSLVRPDFNQSRAGAIVDVDDNEIEGGNPELNPTVAWNLDISHEHYLGSDTYLTVGLFYKAIADAIVEVETQDITLRGNTWDRASTYTNADDSTVLGFEISFQTAFDNGLIFVTNYTLADGETELPEDAVAGHRSIPFFKQARNTLNLVVGYDKGPWDIRLASNYRSEYLDELGDDSLNDRYTSAHRQLDLTARYKVNDELQLRMALLNLNNRPEYYYFGNKSRLSQYDEYGLTTMFGLRYQL